MGPWSDLPLTDQPQELVLSSLTDEELANLARHRQWHLEGTPEGHPDYAATKRRADAVRAEAERRKQAP